MYCGLHSHLTTTHVIFPLLPEKPGHNSKLVIVWYNISHYLYVVFQIFWFRKMDRVFLSRKFGLPKRLFQTFALSPLQFNLICRQMKSQATRKPGTSSNKYCNIPTKCLTLQNSYMADHHSAIKKYLKIRQNSARSGSEALYRISPSG